MKNSKWEDIDWEIKYESLVSIVALFFDSGCLCFCCQWIGKGLQVLFSSYRIGAVVDCSVYYNNAIFKPQE